ncbi:MAG TPA: hypothetical protein V6C58_17540 [Allocoleopsis sp.]
MALIIKDGQTFTDKYQVEHIAGYFRVINFVYQKDSNLMEFYFIGYAAKEARENNVQPFAVIKFDVTGNDFKKWFSYSVLLKNTNLETQAYNYIMQLKDDDGNLTYGNIFESDI